MRLQAWADKSDPFRRGEQLAHVRTYPPGGWWSQYIGVLVIAKNTELRVMRTNPQLELWAPELPPVGRRWRMLESLVPDPEVFL